MGEKKLEMEKMSWHLTRPLSLSLWDQPLEVVIQLSAFPFPTSLCIGIWVFVCVCVYTEQCSNKDKALVLVLVSDRLASKKYK